ncbi:MAG: hypothetical protein QXK12_08640 [Candidatus Nezhaarchaeales archaeon]
MPSRSGIVRDDGIVRDPAVSAVRVSELLIDVDKDWAGKNILNLTPYGFNIDKTTEALISIGFAEAGLQYLSMIYDFIKNGTIPTGLMLFPGKKTWRTADQTYAIYAGSGYGCGSDYVSVRAGRDPSTGYCGSIYVAWNLPSFTELIFIGRPYFGSPASVMLYVNTSTPSALADNYYRLYLHTPNATKDFVLEKKVAGTTTELGYEAVDLTEPGPHTIFLYYNKSTGEIRAYRDGRLKISVTDTSLSPVAVGFHQGNPTYDSVTTYWYSPLFVVVK